MPPKAKNSKRFEVGSRVTVVAVIFNTSGENWAEETFGKTWRTARCAGMASSVLRRVVPSQ